MEAVEAGPELYQIAAQIEDDHPALARTLREIGDAYEANSSENMEMCDACNGAGDDGHGRICGKCDGAGGYSSPTEIEELREANRKLQALRRLCEAGEQPFYVGILDEVIPIFARNRDSRIARPENN